MSTTAPPLHPHHLMSASTSSSAPPPLHAVHSSSTSFPHPSASSSLPPADPASQLRALIETKQQELNALGSYHTSTLQDENTSLRTALQQSAQKYDRLRVDFEYNMSLIQARDVELARYDELIVSYSRTFEEKQQEWLSRIKQAEQQTEQKVMELSDTKDALASLKKSYQESQEKLSTHKWTHESELLSIQHNHTLALKEADEKLRASEERLSTQKYDLTYAFDRNTEKLQAEHSAEIEKLQAQIRQLTNEMELKVKEVQRTTEKLGVEQVKRATLEQRLEETNQKLLQSEANEMNLRDQLSSFQSSHADEISSLNAAHDSLLKKCVADYKTLSSKLSKVESDYLSQTEQHRQELHDQKKDSERALDTSQSALYKQISSLESDLILTQQQFNDSRTLAQSIQSELDAYLQSESSRTHSLNADLTSFQAQHQKQLQELNLTLWKSEEERKALVEKQDVMKKSIDDRRADIAKLKETLAASERTNEELERKLTEQRLKHEKEDLVSQESLIDMKAQLKSMNDAMKRVKTEKEAQEKKEEHYELLINEYESQLKVLRQELLQVHSNENQELEKRMMKEYPHSHSNQSKIKQQLEEMDTDLNEIGQSLRGMAGGRRPSIQYASSTTSPLIRPTIVTTGASSSSSAAMHIPPLKLVSNVGTAMSQPNSSRGIGYIPMQTQTHFPSYTGLASSDEKGIHAINDEMNLASPTRIEISQPFVPSALPQEEATRKVLRPSSLQSDELSPSSPFTLNLPSRTLNPYHHRQLSHPNPISIQLPSAALSSGSAAASPPSTPLTPSVKIVTALQLNLNSEADQHAPVTVELPQRRTSIKPQRKQSITSPNNINLNTGQAQLESTITMPLPFLSIQEQKEEDSHAEEVAQQQQQHAILHSSSSSDDEDDKERSSAFQINAPPPSGHVTTKDQWKNSRIEVLPLHMLEEDNEMIPELVGASQAGSKVGSNVASQVNTMRRKGSVPKVTVDQEKEEKEKEQKGGNVTPPSASSRRIASDRPASASAAAAAGDASPRHTPRPYTPTFSEDYGPVSLPGSMPSSPMAGDRPKSSDRSQPQSHRFVSSQQQHHLQHQPEAGARHLSPPVHKMRQHIPELPLASAQAHHQHQHQNPPPPSQPTSYRQHQQQQAPQQNRHAQQRFDDDAFNPSHRNNESSRPAHIDSHRSSSESHTTHSTTSHTSSHLALEQAANKLSHENISLKSQNTQLSTIIREMKKELENLLVAQEAQQKLDVTAAKDLPPGTMPGTVSIPATQYKSMKQQIQVQANTLAQQTKQAEEQRSAYQKLQFHHSLLMAELESIQQGMSVEIIQHHIKSELVFLRTYTRELNATITNLKTELMYLSAAQQHSSVVLERKHEQAVIVQAQQQQIEQLSVALQFKDHKIVEYESELKTKETELHSIKQQLYDAQMRVNSLQQYAHDENIRLKEQNESMKREVLMRSGVTADQQPSQQQPRSNQSSPPVQQQPQSHPLPQYPPHPHPYAPYGMPSYPPQHQYPHMHAYPPHPNYSAIPLQPQPQTLSQSQGSTQPTAQQIPISGPTTTAHRSHSPPQTSRTDVSDASLDLSPTASSRRHSRSASASPSPSRRDRRHSSSRPTSSSQHDDSSDSLDLSLSGASVPHSRRDLPSRASDRATSSQLASIQSIRVRAELIRAKDAEAKAKADAARARVREQMKRMKEVEKARRSEAIGDTQEEEKIPLATAKEEEKNTRRTSSSTRTTEQPSHQSSRSRGNTTSVTISTSSRDRDRERSHHKHSA